MTGIEHEFEAAVSVATVVASVADRKMLTPELVQITLAGVDLPILGGDEYHYLMVPEHPDELPETLSPENASLAAYYTARARRVVAHEMDLWVVLHSTTEGVARWAANAAVGDQVGVWGPSATFQPPAETTKLLIVCDASGYGAAASILDGLEETQEALVLAEVTDLDHRPPLPDGPRTEIRWLERREAPAGGSDVLPIAVEQLAVDPEGLYVFGAGESREITRVRRHVRDVFGLQAERVSAFGYWRADLE